MSSAEYDASFIAEALPAFVSEAEEQIATIEQLLLQLEDAPDDRGLLDALFRCAHTVKGSAGIFGLDAVVGFTHHVETLLDRLREGEIALTPELSTLLLRCNDQIRQLVAQAQGGEADADGEARRAALIAQLGAQGQTASAPQAAAASVPAPSAAATTRWNVAVTFAGDTFRNGMDPLAILHYLAQAGTIERIACTGDTVPALELLDPENCHLGFDFDIACAQGRDAIEEAFSFVRDDVQLQIAALEAALTGAPVSDVAAARADVVTAPVPGATETARAKGREAGDSNRYIRVQADRLDAVINLLGELVIAGAGRCCWRARAARPRWWRPTSTSAASSRRSATARCSCAWCPSARPSRVSAASCATPPPSSARTSRCTSSAATPSWTSRSSSASPTR